MVSCFRSLFATHQLPDAYVEDAPFSVTDLSIRRNRLKDL